MTDRTNYCIMGIKKVGNMNTLDVMFQHNGRHSMAENADPARKYLNDILVGDNDRSLREVYNERFAEGYTADRPPRRDAIKAFDILLGMTKPVEEQMFPYLQWEQENVRWLEDTFGKDNVLYAVCHKDEGTPHIHATVIPLYEGKMNGSHWMNKAGDLRMMLDSYAERMAQFGLERGESGTHIKHTEMKTVYKAIRREMNYEAPALEQGETAEEYRKKAQDEIIEIKLNHWAEKERLERALKKEQGMRSRDNREAEKKIEDLKSQLDMAKLSEEKAQKWDRLMSGVDRFLSEEERKQMMKEIDLLLKAEEKYEEKEGNRDIDVPGSGEIGTR